MKKVATTSEVDAALANLGKAVATAAPKPILGSRFKSRFFFRLDEEILEERKTAFKPKVLEHIDSETERRLKRYKPTAVPKIEGNINTVREFFLTEIAPIVLATSSGSRQAYEVVERLIDGTVDTSLHSAMETMVARAARLRLAQFVAQLFGLEASAVDDLLGPRTVEAGGNSKLMSMLEGMVKQLEAQNTAINSLTNEKPQPHRGAKSNGQR